MILILHQASVWVRTAALCSAIGVLRYPSAVTRSLTWRLFFARGRVVRLSATVTSLRFDADADEVRETLRIFEGALRPLSKALDELTALEGVLLSRLRDLNQTVAICSRRATLRPSHSQLRAPDFYSCRYFIAAIPQMKFDAHQTTAVLICCAMARRSSSMCSASNKSNYSCDALHL